MQPAPPTPAPPPAPPVQPVQPVQPPPPPVPPPSDPGGGGDGNYGGGGFLKGIDWVEVLFLGAAAFAFFHIIDYYRRKTKQDKANQATLADVSQQVEKLQMNFDGMMRRMRGARRF